jgi:hypothetical protein
MKKIVSTTNTDVHGYLFPWCDFLTAVYISFYVFFPTFAQDMARNKNIFG